MSGTAKIARNRQQVRGGCLLARSELLSARTLDPCPW